ncbi:MAG: Gx transporter family protein, partial [Lachnospiraceae bacterium]|nr:Gx transporter family protein [Lachnospiraceae bacterium]
VGGSFSFLGMCALKKTQRLGILPVSTFGGVLHNLGQLLIAFLFIPSFNLLYYLPVLLFFGAGAGFLVGVLAQEILIRLPKK